MHMKSLLKHCRSELRPMLECLRQAVEIESPTTSKPEVDRLANFFAKELRNCGAQVRVIKHAVAGAAVSAELWLGNAQKPILLLGHLDTVWALGTLAQMPFRVRGGRAFGPGILDMKSGIVILVFAIGRRLRFRRRLALPVVARRHSARRPADVRQRSRHRESV